MNPYDEAAIGDGYTDDDPDAPDCTCPPDGGPPLGPIDPRCEFHGVTDDARPACGCSPDPLRACSAACDVCTRLPPPPACPARAGAVGRPPA